MIRSVFGVTFRPAFWTLWSLCVALAWYSCSPQEPGKCVDNSKCVESTADSGVASEPSVEPAQPDTLEPKVEPPVERAREAAVETVREKPPVREPAPENPPSPEKVKDAGAPEASPEPTPELPKKPKKICQSPPALPRGPFLSHIRGEWHTQAYDYISGTTGPFMDMTSDGSTVAVASFNSMTVQIYKWVNGRYQRVHTLWTGHTRYVRSLRWSRDGKFLATGSLDFSIRLWRTSDWKLIRVLESHYSSVFDVDFSPDGKTLISAGYYDYRIRFWDLSTGLNTKSYYSRSVGGTGSTVVYAVAYSPDSKYIATGTGDHYVKVWDVKTNKVIRNMKGHTSTINSVKYSPDGKWIVSASSDRTARVWNAQTGSLVVTLRNPNTTSDGSSYSATFGKDSRTIVVSGGTDRRLYFYDLLKKEYVYKSGLLQHGSVVRTVRLHPDGNKALSVGYDNLLRVWSLGAKVSQQSFSDIFADLLYRVVLHPNGKLAWVSWSNHPDIQLWDLSQNKEVGRWVGHASGVQALALSPNQQVLASASVTGVIKFWDVGTGKVTRTLTNAHKKKVNHLLYLPTGNTLVSSGEDKVVKLWNASTGKVIRTLSGHGGSVYESAVNPTGTTLVSVGEDRIVRVWSLQNSTQKPKEITGHTDRVLTVAFSPNGQYFATGAYNRRVRVYKTSDSSLLLETYASYSIVRSLAFSPDSKMLAIGTNARKIRIVSLPSGDWVQTFSGHYGPVTQIWFKSLTQVQSIGLDRAIRTWSLQPKHKGRVLQGHTDAVLAARFDFDGATLATASKDKTIRLWDTSTWKLKRTLKGHTGGVTSLAFSPDGKSLVAGDDANQVVLWDLNTGKGTQLKISHQAALVGVAFAPSGAWLLSASSDGQMKVWDLKQSKLLREWKVPSSATLASIALSVDGSVLATTHSDRFVRFWNTSDGKLLRSERRHSNGWTRSVDFDWQKLLLASGGDDNTIRLYNAKSFSYSRGLYGTPGDVVSVKFGPAGELIAAAVANQQIWIWTWRESIPLNILKGHTARIRGLAFHPNGKWLVSVADDKSVRVWALHSNPKTDAQYVRPYSGTLALAHSSKHGTIAVSGDNVYIRLHDSMDRRYLRNMYGHGGRVRALAYHPKSNILYAGSDDRMISMSVVEKSAYKRIRLVSVHAKAVTDLLLTEGGNVLLTASEDQTVKVWRHDPQNGPPRLLNILTHGGAVHQIRASSDGKLLLSWSSDRIVRLWELPTGRLRRTFQVNGTIAGVALRPDGQQLSIATTDGTLRVWNTVEEAEEPNLTKKWQGRPTYLRYDPKSKYLAVAFEQKQLLLLEASCYRELRRLESRFGKVQVMKWSLEGDSLYLGDSNGGVTTWWCRRCKP